MKNIAVQDLEKVLSEKKENSIIIDVRTPGEFRGINIQGVVNIPLDQLDNYREKLAQYQEVYVHCESGNRSQQACQKLKDLGLDNLVNVQGGLGAWQEAGLPVSESKGVISLMRQVQISAGSLALIGAILAQTLHPNWIYLSGFVGAGLLFAGLTGTCAMATLLSKMPWNQ